MGRAHVDKARAEKGRTAAPLAPAPWAAPPTPPPAAAAGIRPSPTTSCSASVLSRQMVSCLCLRPGRGRGQQAISSQPNVSRRTVMGK